MNLEAIVTALLQEDLTVRVHTCWACGATVVQLGRGRPRVLCHSPRCERKRRAYNLREASWLNQYF